MAYMVLGSGDEVAHGTRALAHACHISGTEMACTVVGQRQLPHGMQVRQGSRGRRSQFPGCTLVCTFVLLRDAHAWYCSAAHCCA
eukprot:439434-Rhodomonas_salina.2